MMPCVYIATKNDLVRVFLLQGVKNDGPKYIRECTEVMQAFHNGASCDKHVNIPIYDKKKINHLLKYKFEDLENKKYQDAILELGLDEYLI